MKMTLIALCAAAFELAADAGWRVQTYGDGDRVAVSEKDGVVDVSFSIEPRTLRATGCWRYLDGWADILFDSPLPLADATECIRFEQSMPLKCDRTKVLLLPLVRDGDGEVFSFSVHEMMSLGVAKGRGALPFGAWTRVATPSFYAGEAGAPASDVFSLESAGVDFTPSGKLEFLGFRLKLRQEPKAFKADETDRRRDGRLFFAAVQPGDAKLPFTTPSVFADALLSKKGEYMVSAAVRNAFQAVPIHEFSKAVSFDPMDAASRRSRIEFPCGPDGCYWIDWQVSDNAGRVVNFGAYRADVYGSPDAAMPKPVDTKRPPAFGAMRVNPDHPGCGVYGADDTAEIRVRIFGDAVKTVAWKVLPLTFSDVLDEGVVSAAPEIAIVPKRFADRPAYRLVIEARDAAGKTVDSQTYFYGFRNGLPLAGHDRAGSTVNRREYKKHPYNRTTYFFPSVPKGEPTEREYLAHYSQFLVNSVELATSFTYMVDLRDWEALPGVYDTWLLDHVMDMAADAGMKVTLRFAHGDKNESNLYRWNTYERQVGADGSVLMGHRYYGAYSVPDPKTQKFWLDAMRASHDRYASHTAFEGYYVMQPGGEWTAVDQPWKGTLSGYDPATRADFVRWQKERHGADCPAVEPPMPTFRDGLRPDFRREWIDFCRYKATLGGRWMQTCVGAIRSYDDDRLVITYSRPNDLARLLGDKIDYGHNGGNHSVISLYDFIDAWKRHGIGWISEPHHPHAWCAYGDPADRGWTLDWTTWIMTAQAAGGGANIHIYYHPWGGLGMERINTWGGRQGLDRFETFKPILNELHEMEVLRPAVDVAFASDEMTLWTKHRTTFGARLTELRLCRELLNADMIPHGDLVPEGLSDYRLIMANFLDVAIEAESYSNYVKAVRDNGATIVLTANTGSYVPELFGDTPFSLLKAFGIEPPSAPFCRKGRDVSAVCGDGSGLFGKGRKLPFMTNERLHAQLLDDEVQKRFWNYRFRWMPETDYYGYYPGVETDGQTLATFPDGGAAISRHKVGKGEAIVFWGLPDYDGDNMKGVMAAIARHAGCRNPYEGLPVAHFIEGENRKIGRHYLLLWQETPGTYAVNVPNIPDGKWFVDDSVSGQRIGLFDGKALREKGISVTWTEGYSPLKYLRFSLQDRWFSGNDKSWSVKYRNETK